MKGSFPVVVLLVLPPWLVAAAPARAADQAEQALPEIIVTPVSQPVDAERLPMTLDTLSGTALAAAGLHDTIALQYAIPGFVFKSNSVLGQPYLRGVGSELITAGAESSVATFVDGVYLPRAYDTIVDFFDVERVDVLKGPQAVQLGRNVVGGAVSVHTTDPGFDRDGYVSVGAGGYAEHRLQAAANLPLPSHKVALRLAGASARRDGYVTNVFLHTDEDSEHHDAFRAKLLYAPADNLRLVVGSEHHAENSSRELGLQPVPGVGVNGGIELGGIVPAAPREVTEDVAPRIHVREGRDSARLTWRRERFELLSTTAYVASDAALALDLDGTNAAFAANYPTTRSRAVMQELRLTSTRADPFAWTAGAFLLDERNEQVLDTRLPPVGERILPDAHVATRSYALFGELAYRLGERWRGRAGLRYNVDDRHIDLVRSISTPAVTTVSTQNDGRRWHALTPEVTLEYAPRMDRLYYLTASRGYKPGGFNTSAIQPPFNPESLRAYEAGIKATAASGRLHVDAAAFYYDYADMQLDTPPSHAPVGTFPIVINAARSSLRGLDLRLVARPAGAATSVSLGATLLDARFTDFVSVDPNVPMQDPNRDGNRMPQAPRVSLTLRVTHARPVPGGQVTLAAGYRYQSAMYFDIYADPALRQPGYGLVDVSLGFRSAEGRWSATLYGRNLTDTLYAQTMLRRDPLTGTKRFWGPPRTVGVELAYRW